MSYYPYHWCAVPECKNTSVKTPDKLWIQVPTDLNIRKTWFKLARRDPTQLSEKSRLYFCEDHFDVSIIPIHYLSKIFLTIGYTESIYFWKFVHIWRLCKLCK